jgi:hypothetical protein
MAVPTWALCVVLTSGWVNARACRAPLIGEAIAFGCSALLSWREGKVGLSPGGGERKQHRRPRKCPDSAEPYPSRTQGRVRGSPRGLNLCPWSLSQTSQRHCATMVEIAGTTPAMTESAATSFAPVTGYRIFLDGPPLQSKQPAPRWMS